MDLPSVTEFYDGKSILLTGATGFVGVVLLEELLRICQGIKSIYIVLRTKKGVDPKERLEKMLERKIFYLLKQEQPEVLEKIHIIAGDLTKPNLGISEEDIQTIVDEVSIIFHVAASISFVLPLKSMLEQNFLSTHILVELCRKLKKCDVFVYCSSSSANSNRFDIDTEEEVYRLPFRPSKFLNILKDGTDEELLQLHSQCFPPWPNTYTFSKCLTEDYLVENASDIPVAIVRPSIIAATHEKPFPGYGEDNSGASAMALGICKGVIRVLYSDPENTLDIVPADFSAHAHIIAAARIHSDRWKSPLLINCASVHVLQNLHKVKMCLELGKTHLTPLAFREPTDVKLVHNRLWAKILTFYEHFVPAYGIDLILRLSGKKPKLVKVYNFVDKALGSTAYFGTHNFRFKTEKFQKLMRELNDQDKKMFVNPDAGEYTLKYIHEHTPFYDWSKDKKTPAERRSAAKRNELFTNMSKAIFLIMVGGFLLLLVWLLNTML